MRRGWACGLRQSLRFQIQACHNLSPLRKLGGYETAQVVAAAAGYLPSLPCEDIAYTRLVQCRVEVTVETIENIARRAARREFRDVGGDIEIRQSCFDHGWNVRQRIRPALRGDCECTQRAGLYVRQ